MRLVTRCLIFSLLILVGCANIPKPKGHICQLDTVHLREICFDMEKDYDDNAQIKPGAEQKIIQHESAAAMLEAIDKSTNFRPEPWKEVKIYVRAVRAECQKGEQSVSQVVPEREESPAIDALQLH